MDNLIKDVRYGFRMLIKQPGFTVVAVLALALGIGANTAIFSVVNAVLLRPLPFSEPGRLIAVWESDLRLSESRGSVSYPNFLDWRDQNQVFERMAAYHDGNYTLTGGDEPARLTALVASADLFPLLGVAPALGRNFLPEEDKPGNRVVILSHKFWQQRFGSDPEIIGRSLVIDGNSFNVVGVMPAGFQFPINREPFDLWTTIAGDSITINESKPMNEERGAHYLQVTARLKPAVTLEQAQAEMATIAGSLEQAYPDSNSHKGVRLVPQLDDLVGDIRPALMILLGAVGCVLLIACANIANLLLARATTRHKEMAIRAALGASRMRVVRQLLTESVLLALAGGALGLLVALWGTDLLTALSHDGIPRATEVGVDRYVLAFTAAVSLLTGIIFGVVPALHASRADLNESLKEGGRGSTDGLRRNRLRGMLVVVEVAVALVLLVGAGLLIQSMLRLQRVNPGFNSHNLMTMQVGLPSVKYSTAQQIEFYKQLVARISALPGVVSASAALPLPLTEINIGVGFDIEGRPTAKGERPSTAYRSINLDYFRTLGIPLLKGRDFNERDSFKSAPVVINETLAKRFFPDEDPIGKHIRPTIAVDEAEPLMREIIGVVGDVRHKSLSEESGPEVYVPHAQIPFDFMTLVARTENNPRAIIPAVQEEVRALDKDLPVYEFQTLDEYVANSLAQPRFNTLLLAIFAALALVLTAVGLYGVVSYSVAQRTHEMGIRIALGAKPSDVLRLVVGQGMALALIGVGIGLVGAFLTTRVMASLLFGVSTTDPLTFTIISVILIGVALGACFVPARRATKVDPMVALRYE